MARKTLERDAFTKTSLVTYKELYDRACTQARKNGEDISSFLTRAIVNQLEREGDIDIRSIIREFGREI